MADLVCLIFMPSGHNAFSSTAGSSSQDSIFRSLIKQYNIALCSRYLFNMHSIRKYFSLKVAGSIIYKTSEALWSIQILKIYSVTFLWFPFKFCSPYSDCLLAKFALVPPFQVELSSSIKNYKKGFTIFFQILLQKSGAAYMLLVPFSVPL